MADNDDGNDDRTLEDAIDDYYEDGYTDLTEQIDGEYIYDLLAEEFDMDVHEVFDTYFGYA